MPRKDPMAGAATAQAQQESVVQGIDAYELPKSIVTKLARSALPENAKMQKDMLLAVMKGSTVFVNYLAASAHEVANSRQHKSVSASDVLRALEQMDMGDIVPKLQAELDAYRGNQKTDKSKKNSKAKTKDADTASIASTKGKGKEKVSGPTITIPGKSSASVSSKSRSAPELVDSETEDAQGHEQEDDDEDEEMAEAEMSDVEADDGVEESDLEGDEGDENVDNMAIEEEELKRDSRGVEERDQDMDDD